MVDFISLRAELAFDGAAVVRHKLAEGRYGEAKVPVVREWLREQDQLEEQQQVRRNREQPLSGLYRPTAADLAYSQAVNGPEELNPFDEAIYLQTISDAYLSVLAADHAGERSADFQAMIQVELVRRGNAEGKQANKLARLALWIAGATAGVTLISLFLG